MSVTAAIVYGLTRGQAAPASSRPLSVFGVSLPPHHALTASQSPLVDISADGRTLLFVAEGEKGTSVFRRSLDSMTITSIDGSSGAANPVLSPDGHGRVLRGQDASQGSAGRR